MFAPGFGRTARASQLAGLIALCGAEKQRRVDEGLDSEDEGGEGSSEGNTFSIGKLTKISVCIPLNSRCFDVTSMWMDHSTLMISLPA